MYECFKGPKLRQQALLLLDLDFGFSMIATVWVNIFKSRSTFREVKSFAILLCESFHLTYSQLNCFKFID